MYVRTYIIAKIHIYLSIHTLTYVLLHLLHIFIHRKNRPKVKQHFIGLSIGLEIYVVNAGRVLNLSSKVNPYN